MSNEYMQNEFERDNPEENEYHFSDDGAYDTCLEEEVKDQATVLDSSGLANRFSSYRRFVLIGGIFAGLLLVVYLFLSPVATPPTEIMTVAAVQPTTAVPANKTSTKVASQLKNETPAFKKMVAAHEKLSNPSSAIQSTAAPAAAPSATQPVLQPAESVVANAPVTPMSTADSSGSLSVAVPATMPASRIDSMVPMPTLSAAQDNKAILDRLVALEEANTKLIAQLHSEYSRKMADADTQDKAVEEQIRAMANKISSMEAQISQLLQLINKQQQTLATPASASNDNVSNPIDNNAVALPGPSTNSSKPPYSVQAIIPGRAWLKTESGETITVAEGDTLKNVGRITKIDPYDGTIQIDTGSRLILLTYGNEDYA